MVSIEERTERLQALLGRVVPVPEQWLLGTDGKPLTGINKSKRKELCCSDCSSWRDLRNEWRKALKWTDGLDWSLSVMRAPVISTKLLGDPIVVKVIGPASSGKSTLCEALSVNKRYVHAESIINGFHSGFRM